MSIIKYCMDCGKKLSNGAKSRCQKCYHKSRRKPANYCQMCGKVIGRKYTHCIQCAGKKLKDNETWRQKIVATAKRRAQDHQWREGHSKAMKEAWARGVYDNRGEEWRKKKSEAQCEAWAAGRYEGVHQTEDFRKKRARAAKKAWSDGVYDTPEYKQAQSERVRGASNPQWRGGTSFEPYSPDFTKDLKQSIQERDGFRCVLCGSDKRLHIHHIDYDKKNSDLSNLVTLCNSCHGKTMVNRTYWQEILSAKIREIVDG